MCSLYFPLRGRILQSIYLNTGRLLCWLLSRSRCRSLLMVQWDISQSPFLAVMSTDNPLLHIRALQAYYEATISLNEHHELEDVSKDSAED